MIERPTVSDGGIETDLIFNRGVELPHFAAFPLFEHAAGRELVADYYAQYAAIARAADAGLMLESATWRANPDWGDLLGYDRAGLDRANRGAITFLKQLRDRFELPDTVVGGTLGPRGDGYVPGEALSPEASAEYHRPQLEAFAAAGADIATAYTLTHTGEAIGIVTAARAAGVPVAISFTVETDGRLADGTTLADAITTVDEAAPPDHFLVNCAHPTHLAHALAQPGPWHRIVGLQANASRLSHAELDESDELDSGDPTDFAATNAAIEPLLPNLLIRGGCCGTDTRHVAALWGVQV